MVDEEKWYSETGHVLNFVKMPRYMGNPHQQRVSDKRQLFNALKMWEKMGYCCFVSLYCFKPGRWCIVDHLYNDLDDEKKPEHALSDIREIIEWCEKENFQHVGIFTGSKGYHSYVILKPQRFSIRKIEQATELKLKLRAVSNWIGAKGWLWQRGDDDKLVNPGNFRLLRTLDIRVKGDYRRLVRVPGYRYSKFKNSRYFVKDTYCMVVPNDIMMEFNHATIIKRCKKWHPIKPVIDRTKDLLTLDEFMERFDIRIEDWLKMGGSKGIAVYSQYKGNYTHPQTEVIKKMFQKPCIHNDILGSSEPSHITRLYVAVLLLNYYKWPPEKVIEFFKNLNMADWSEEETKIQVYQIAFNDPPYNTPNCSTLKHWGLCVKDKCGQYFNTSDG